MVPSGDSGVVLVGGYLHIGGMGKLTPKQERFCHEYVVDLNASAAAIRAGYSARSARSSSDRCMKNADVQSKIQDLQKDQAVRTGITADMVLKKLWSIVEFDLRTLVGADGAIGHPTEWPDGAAAAVTGLSESQHGRNVRIESKLKALELVGRHLGMFVDRVNHEGAESQVHIYLPDNGRASDG